MSITNLIWWAFVFWLTGFVLGFMVKTLTTLPFYSGR